ncbi:MAG: hypothetical protein CMI54_01985 [Parcubacteria group bacterium]|nr:hypothetical protein [Parcubacteria group bacterium]|tara:strand:+ start:3742 stop:4098 length:357 start_codon:yes stop_codon:yes gene_type:complete
MSRSRWKHISRNINGIDVRASNQSSQREITVQVLVDMDSKSVPFGNEIENLSADFVIVCTPGRIEGGKSDKAPYPLPNIFVMTNEETRTSVTKTEGSYFLDRDAYSSHKDKWEKIGFG